MKIDNNNKSNNTKQSSTLIEKAKLDFLASVSYEMRIPINEIIGMLGLLSDTDLDDEQSKYMEIINGSIENLLNIINDILDFFNMKSKKIILQEEQFNIKDCIEEVIDLYSLKAKTKKIKINYSIENNVPVSIFADVAKIRQILIF